jgi:allantoinase
VIDANGLHVFAGGLDPHVHAGDLGWTHREDFAGVSAAALAGGITTMLEMPQNEPPTTTVENLRLKRTAVEARVRIDCGLWGAIVPGNLDNLESLWRAGVFAFKAFMVTAKDIPRVDDYELVSAMQLIAAFGGLIGIHCENDALVIETMANLKKSGRTDRAAHLASRSMLAETEAVGRAMLFARSTGVRLHVCHLSVGSLCSNIRAARAAGTDVTVETCAHYLTLTDEDYLRIGPAAKCVPPPRPASEREALWAGLAEGIIDMVASDHAPHPVAEKRSGEKVVWDAPNGIQGIQLSLPLLLSEGVHRRGLPLARLAEVFSTAAAKRFGLYPRKGSLRLGADADLVVADTRRVWEFTEGNIIAKHRMSPYVGRRLTGSVAYTVSGGRIVFANGTVVAKPGSGRWIGNPLSWATAPAAFVNNPA